MRAGAQALNLFACLPTKVKQARRLTIRCTGRAPCRSACGRRSWGAPVNSGSVRRRPPFRDSVESAHLSWSSTRESVNRPCSRKPAGVTGALFGRTVLVRLPSMSPSVERHAPVAVAAVGTGYRLPVMAFRQVSSRWRRAWFHGLASPNHSLHRTRPLPLSVWASSVGRAGELRIR